MSFDRSRSLATTRETRTPEKYTSRTRSEIYKVMPLVTVVRRTHSSRTVHNSMIKTEELFPLSSPFSTLHLPTKSFSKIKPPSEHISVHSSSLSPFLSATTLISGSLPEPQIDVSEDVSRHPISCSSVSWDTLKFT